jgi:hypothetical protein
LLPHSLINPNQLRAYGLTVNDDPFDHTRDFGIDLEQTFIPFDTTGTVVHFESRVPTEWEKTHLPTILITGEDWNPTEEVLRPNVSSQEDIEMRHLKSLSSRQINSVAGTVQKAEIELHGEIERQLGDISQVYNEREFCNRLISAVNIATPYRDDIDQREAERRACSIISNDRPPKYHRRNWQGNGTLGFELRRTL